MYMRLCEIVCSEWLSTRNPFATTLSSLSLDSNYFLIVIYHSISAVKVYNETNKHSLFSYHLFEAAKKQKNFKQSFKSFMLKY